MAFNNSLLLSVSCAESFTVICLSVMPDESLKFSVSDTDKCLEWTRGSFKNNVPFILYKMQIQKIQKCLKLQC